MKIGIDLDNTIILYDHAFRHYAGKLYHISTKHSDNKFSIRERLRKQPNGEKRWTQLQGEVYTRGMEHADFAPGFTDTLTTIMQTGIPVVIISHKTKYPAIGPKIDMRTIARQWLRRKGIIGKKYGITDSDIIFADTREEKVAQIIATGCTVWIDDLPEVFRERSFPNTIQRILFGEADERLSGVITCKDWASVERALLLEEIFLRRVAKEMLSTPILSLTALNDSVNCRVYKGTTSSRAFLLKRYRAFPGDTRDRLRTESVALEFLNNMGENAVPKVIATDPKNNIALYEWIEGENLRRKPVGEQEITEAISFIKRLHGYRSGKAANALPMASEASTSIGGYVQSVDDRVKPLLSLKSGTAVERNARDFIRKTLAPDWKQIHQFVVRQSKSRRIAVTQSFPEQELTLSPSDFGFHNCLKRDGKLVFIDFEYFGWDDPAKLIADITLHPAMRLSRKQTRRCERELLEFYANEAIRLRYDLVRLVLSVKWTTIMLNSFVRDHKSKDAIARCKRQLSLAKLQHRRTMIEFERLKSSDKAKL